MNNHLHKENHDTNYSEREEKHWQSASPTKPVFACGRCHSKCFIKNWTELSHWILYKGSCLILFLLQNIFLKLIEIILMTKARQFDCLVNSTIRKFYYTGRHLIWTWNVEKGRYSSLKHLIFAFNLFSEAKKERWTVQRGQRNEGKLWEFIYNTYIRKLLECFFSFSVIMNANPVTTFTLQ